MKKLLLLLFLLQANHLNAQNCFEKCKDDLETSKLGYMKANIDVISKLVGCKAPDFDVRTITGERVRLHDLKGKVVVINFWFIGCPPCVAEMPALNRLVEEYSKKDVVFIAFAQDDESSLKKFLAERKFDYKIVSEEFTMVDRYCIIAGWPMNMVLDKEGVLRQVFTGGHTDEKAKTYAYEQIQPKIEELLKEK